MSRRAPKPRQLNVTVIGCSNLKPGVASETDRNIQVQLEVGDMTASSAIKSGNLAPEFGEKFQVVITADVAPILVLNVMHKEDPSKDDSKEDCLGVVKVKLGLLEGRPPKDVRYNLEKKTIFAVDEPQGDMHLLLEYTNEITIDNEQSNFTKMAQMPKSGGKLLEHYMHEMEKLRVQEKDLERKITDTTRKCDKVIKEKEKLEEVVERLQKGSEVLEKLKELDRERTVIEEKYHKLQDELEEREQTISRKDKQIMQLEKQAAQNARMVHRMSTHVNNNVASAAAQAATTGLMPPLGGEMGPPAAAADPDDVASALEQLDVSMPVGGGDAKEDDAESDDEDEEGGQPDEEGGEETGDVSKMRRKMEKEKAAKLDWKAKYEDMENLYNEIVVHRQQQMAEMAAKTTELAKLQDSSSNQKYLDEISQLREDLAASNEEKSQLQMEMKLAEGQLDDAMKKYRKEAKERKKLYNEIQELKGNIRVYARCRPISSAELERGATDATAFGDLDDVTIFTEAGVKKTFEYDKTFDQNSTQEKVFEDTMPLMQSVLDGFNVCIFAYGQTGSGKTFTMQGPMSNPGVNIRALQTLFTLVTEKGEDYDFEMGISMFEIYCEQIRDLLITGSGNLNIRQEKRAGRVHNYVDGLSQQVVTSVEDVTRTIELANQNRSTASTNMNQHSSRSHLIMSVDVATIDKLSNKRTQAALHMIDLAGSERVGRSGVQGQALKEAQSINQSLSSLGNVLSALGAKQSHVPYRDSKLTHSLADALGGNSKVLMFCNISPSSDNVAETLSSLQFATRTRAVELGKATANVSADPPPELADDDEKPAKPADSKKPPAAAAKPGARGAAAARATPTKAATPARAGAAKTAASPRAAATPRAAAGARTSAAAVKKPLGRK